MRPRPEPEQNSPNATLSRPPTGILRSEYFPAEMEKRTKQRRLDGIVLFRNPSRGNARAAVACCLLQIACDTTQYEHPHSLRPAPGLKRRLLKQWFYSLLDRPAGQRERGHTMQRSTDRATGAAIHRAVETATQRSSARPSAGSLACPMERPGGRGSERSGGNAMERSSQRATDLPR